MLDNQTSHEVVSNSQNSQPVSFHQNGARGLANILFNSVYPDIYYAAAREPLTNAADGLAKIGLDLSQATVTVPTFAEPIFVVEDCGIGMSHEHFINHAAQFGNSPKVNDANANGFMGIGLKVSLAISDTFTITCAHEGVETTYLMFLDETRIPRFKEFGSRPVSSTWKTGVRIEVPISEDRINKMVEGIVKACKGLEQLPKFKNLKAEHLARIEESRSVLASHGRTSLIKAASAIQMSNIVYPARFSQFLGRYSNFESGFQYRAHNGSVRPTASRESLEMDRHSIQGLEKIEEEIHIDFAHILKDKISSSEGVWDASKKLRSLFQSWGVNCGTLRDTTQILLRKNLLTEKEFEILNLSIGDVRMAIQPNDLLHDCLFVYRPKNRKGDKLLNAKNQLCRYVESISYVVGGSDLILVENDCPRALRRLEKSINSGELAKAILLPKKHSAADIEKISASLHGIPVIKASTFMDVDAEPKEKTQRTMRVWSFHAPSMTSAVETKRLELPVTEAYRECDLYFVESSDGKKIKGRSGGISVHPYLVSGFVRSIFFIEHFGSTLESVVFPRALILSPEQEKSHLRKCGERIIPSAEEYAARVLGNKEFYAKAGLNFLSLPDDGIASSQTIRKILEIIANANEIAHAAVLKAAPKACEFAGSAKSDKDLARQLREANLFQSVEFDHKSFEDNFKKLLNSEIPWLDSFLKTECETIYAQAKLWKGEGVLGKIFLRMLDSGASGDIALKKMLESI